MTGPSFVPLLGFRIRPGSGGGSGLLVPDVAHPMACELACGRVYRFGEGRFWITVPGPSGRARVAVSELPGLLGRDDPAAWPDDPFPGQETGKDPDELVRSADLRIVDGILHRWTDCPVAMLALEPDGSGGRISVSFEPPGVATARRQPFALDRYDDLLSAAAALPYVDADRLTHLRRLRPVLRVRGIYPSPSAGVPAFGTPHNLEALPADMVRLYAALRELGPGELPAARGAAETLDRRAIALADALPLVVHGAHWLRFELALPLARWRTEESTGLDPVSGQDPARISDLLRAIAGLGRAIVESERIGDAAAASRASRERARLADRVMGSCVSRLVPAA